MRFHLIVVLFYFKTCVKRSRGRFSQLLEEVVFRVCLYIQVTENVWENFLYERFKDFFVSKWTVFTSELINYTF